MRLVHWWKNLDWYDREELKFDAIILAIVIGVPVLTVIALGGCS